LLIELTIGYPNWLSRSIGHPVTWMGRLISWFDRRLNRDSDAPETRRRAGAVTVLALLIIVGAVSIAIELSLTVLPFGILAVALVASTLLAQRSLFVHIADVADALEEGNINAAREAVARVVGRDTTDLDEAGIARAAIESLAENFSDGVVAPSLWMVVVGLPGAAFYKAINTADSMIGHRNERYRYFGQTAAKLDDIVNLPPSRLSALLIIASAYFTRGASAASAWKTMRRDASRHASPNAGYPEAAMAGALGLALGGPRSYAAAQHDGAWMGDGRSEANTQDIHDALRLYASADGLLIAIVFVLAAITVLA